MSVGRRGLWSRVTSDVEMVLDRGREMRRDRKRRRRACCLLVPLRFRLRHGSESVPVCVLVAVGCRECGAYSTVLGHRLAFGTVVTVLGDKGVDLGGSKDA